MKTYKSLETFLKEKDKKDLIPIYDTVAWIKLKPWNFVYDKLFIADSQQLPCGPWGTYPNKYPIIMKPIINLFGMSRGFKLIKTEKEYDSITNADGHIWEKYLTGDNLTIDLIIINGQIKDYYPIRSIPCKNGSFKYHETLLDYRIHDNIILWIANYLSDYIGVINMEVIGSYIIEMHLRLNNDFYYDDIFVDQLIEFYQSGKYTVKKNVRKKQQIFFFPIFLNKSYQKSPDFDKNKKLISDLLEKTDLVKSVRWFDLDSLSNWVYKRWLTFETYSLKEGLKIKSSINKIISL